MAKRTIASFYIDFTSGRITVASMRNQLAYIRAARGLSQAELARVSGVAQMTISSIERGDSAPIVRTVAKLATALGMSAEELDRQLAPGSTTSPAEVAK